MVSLTIVFIPPIVRVAESVTTSVRNLDFVDAARASGAGPLTIMRVHVLGNVLGPIFVYATSLISVCMILGGRPFVPRSRHQAAGARMGPDAQHAAHRDLRQSVGRGAARRDDLHGLDLLQSSERRNAECDGCPKLNADAPADRIVGGPAQPLLEVRGLTKHFAVRGGFIGKAGVVRAVDNVNFSVARARCWASSANPAAANRRRRAWSSASSRPTRARSCSTAKRSAA